ncbi:hypothetical protein KCU95_g3106, partial [Aureobasidium melanogenum]
MATPECIRLLEPQLSPCSGLDWLIYGQPVIALFSKSGNPAYTAFDREYLGQSSRHTRGQSLKLWVACDDTNRLLVVLTQEIQVSSGKKPRIFYLCISVESLSVDTASPAYWAISDGVVPLNPLNQLDNTNTRPDQTSRLLRISFSPAAKSYVIMPDFPHTGRVSEASMSLLRKLKALSQAPYFDLFTTHDSWTYQSLLRLQAILSDRTVTDFNINYNNFYPGGRRAIIDAWESQGWWPLVEEAQDRGEMEPECRQGLKRKHDSISNVDVPGIESLAPPPYDLPVPDLSSAAAPEATLGAALGAASTASFDMAAVLAKEYVESGRESVLSEVYPRGRSISLPPETTFKPLSPNFDFTPIASGVVPAVTPEPTTPVCIVSSSPFRSVALSLQIDNYSPAAPASIAKRPPQAPPHYVCKSPLSHVPETPPSYTLPTCKAIATATSSRSILINWLATLLRRYPYFHYICITELLALGSEVRRGDAEDTIRRLRARCLASLLEQITDYDHLEVEHEFTIEGSSELEELVSWLLLLNPDGDFVFLEQLSKASRALKDVRKSEHIRGLAATPRSSDGALFDHPHPTFKDECASVNEFMVCKASIILDACMAFGDSTLGQSKHEIKDRMLQEMERSIR